MRVESGHRTTVILAWLLIHQPRLLGVSEPPTTVTSVPDIYAAGDLVLSLDQISVGMGQAAIAAPAIHNDLRIRDEKADSFAASGTIA